MKRVIGTAARAVVSRMTTTPAPSTTTLLGSTCAMTTASLCTARRFQSNNNNNGFGEDDSTSSMEHGLDADLHADLADAVSSATVSTSVTLNAMADATTTAEGELVRLVKLPAPPAKFNLLSRAFVYRWDTTAALARKVVGPMREWALELKYRTGVHIEQEPTFPEKIASGAYQTADEVELSLYLFGSDRGVANCKQIMEAAVKQDPTYVRCGIFRRMPNSGGVEWLTLRRINSDTAPPDVPKISLKLPGKYTLMYETYKEAAVRSLYEETGVHVDPKLVYPTAVLQSNDPKYFWRVPVRYFMAEVPHDVTITGPVVAKERYMTGWDPRVLRQSPDPIDRSWAQLADPVTGCAWMTGALLDELQKPRRGENYMAVRYTPPEYAQLREVVGLVPPPEPEVSESPATDTLPPSS